MRLSGRALGPFLAGAVAAVLISTSSARAQVYQIDGFSVQALPSPSIPTVPVASHTEGTIYYGSNTPYGTTPYTGNQASNAAYVSMYEVYINHPPSATFPVKDNSTTLYIQWGTLDTENSLTFYATSAGRPVQVGALQGADLAAVYGLGTSNYFKVVSPVPFDRVVAGQSSGCCFEFGDLTAQ